jgi:hypothetical protein
MNKKMVGFLVLVLAVLAFALFTPYGVSAAGPKQYKIIAVEGQNRFEGEVTAALNDGWSPVGGVAIGIGRSDRFYSQALVK